MMKLQSVDATAIATFLTAAIFIINSHLPDFFAAFTYSTD